MKKKVFVAAVFVFLFCVMLPVLLVAVSRKNADRAASRVQPLPQYDMVHVLLYGYDRDTVSGRITLYSEDGNVVSTIERSWNADSVMISFAEFSYGSKVFVFPYSVSRSGSGKAFSGIYLPNYYLSANKCHLVSSKKAEEIQKEYARIAHFATSRFFSKFSSSRSIQTVNLSLCQPGIEYEIQFTQQGKALVFPVAGDYLS